MSKLHKAPGTEPSYFYQQVKPDARFVPRHYSVNSVAIKLRLGRHGTR